MKYREAKMLLFLSDSRGVYIPRDFADSIRRDRVTGISDDDYADLENPNSETYWDTWASVCDNAVITDSYGVCYFIHQDGDCWLVEQGATYNEGLPDCDLGTMYVVELPEDES